MLTHCEIECLYCGKKIDSRISWAISVDLMKKHVKENHPDKSQL